MVFVEMLDATVTASGRYNYLKHLCDAIRVMAPEQDWSWLQGIARRLARLVKPRSKRERMVASIRLFDLGIRLMETAELQLTKRRLAGAIQYRDGLVIALLAARPIRRRNLTGIRIGGNLIKIGDHYALKFDEAETKNHQPLEFPLPELLTSHLDRYLSEIRSLFLSANEHDGLWASVKGGPMTEQAIYSRVCKRTEATFGHAINPHLFRDCAATSLAIEDPGHVRVARDLLGHSRLDTTEQYYIQARSLDASRYNNKRIASLRSSLNCRPTGSTRSNATRRASLKP